MIKDSGDRTEFETGAKRDMHAGKGRMDLLPWYGIMEVRATYHQIVRLTDDELRINLRYAPLSRAGVDFEEIAHDGSISSFL